MPFDVMCIQESHLCWSFVISSVPICPLHITATASLSPCLPVCSDEVVHFHLRISASQPPKSYEPLDSAAPPYVRSLWKHVTRSWFKPFFLNLFQYPVCPLVSFGCGGGWHFGPAASELPGVARGAYDDRRHESGYFLEGKRKADRTERKHVSGAAGGELRRGQLHLPQQEWIPPQLHCGPDPRGWKREEEDPCENRPRYSTILKKMHVI